MVFLGVEICGDKKNFLEKSVFKFFFSGKRCTFAKNFLLFFLYKNIIF